MNRRSGGDQPRGSRPGRPQEHRRRPHPEDGVGPGERRVAFRVGRAEAGRERGGRVPSGRAAGGRLQGGRSANGRTEDRRDQGGRAEGRRGQGPRREVGEPGGRRTGRLGPPGEHAGAGGPPRRDPDVRPRRAAARSAPRTGSARPPRRPSSVRRRRPRRHGPAARRACGSCAGAPGARAEGEEHEPGLRRRRTAQGPASTSRARLGPRRDPPARGTRAVTGGSRRWPRRPRPTTRVGNVTRSASSARWRRRCPVRRRCASSSGSRCTARASIRPPRSSSRRTWSSRARSISTRCSWTARAPAVTTIASTSSGASSRRCHRARRS